VVCRDAFVNQGATDQAPYVVVQGDDHAFATILRCLASDIVGQTCCHSGEATRLKAGENARD
jgi:polyphosphate kinase 2 (PPK2 family)